LLEVEVDRQTLDARRKLRVPYTVNSKTGQEAFIFDPAAGEKIKEMKWPKPVDPAFVGFLIQQPPRLAKPAAQVEVSARRSTAWVPYLEAVAAANPGLKADCRKRFSALFGCACAVDGLGVETCAGRLAAALGFDEMPREYLSAMKRGLEVCSKRIAEGRKPLFSIRRALTLDAGDGEGKVWYSIRECITAKPPAVPSPAEGAVQAAAEGGEEAPAAGGGEEQEAYVQDGVRQEVSEAVLNGGGEEETWEELEEFIAAHRAAGAERRRGVVEKMSIDEVLRIIRDMLKKHGYV